MLLLIYFLIIVEAAAVVLINIFINKGDGSFIFLEFLNTMEELIFRSPTYSYFFLF